jgi:RNA polymerase primary sigma factor
MGNNERKSEPSTSRDLYLTRDLRMPEVELIEAEEVIGLSQRISRAGMANSILHDIMSGNFTGERSLSFKKKEERTPDTPIAMSLARELLEGVKLADAIVLVASEGEKDRNGKKLTDGKEAAAKYAWRESLASMPEGEIDEVKHKLEKVMEDAEEARKGLITANLRLVASIAKTYPEDKDFDFVDHVQNGEIGLMQAARKFDWRLGYKFSTYAARWIRQSIGREIKAKGGAIHVPLHLQDLRGKVYAAYERVIESTKDGEPDLESVAQIVNEETPTRGYMVKRDTVEYILFRDPEIRNIVSLNTPLGPESDETLLDVVASDQEDPSSSSVQSSHRERLLGLIGQLDEHERIIIIGRFNLDRKGIRTLKELAREVGLSGEGVRLVEARVLRKLKKIAGGSGLQEDSMTDVDRKVS